jgi:hypothetical protein
MPASAAIPAYRDEATRPRLRTKLPSTSRGAVDLLLLFGTVAMALGLALVTASLTPSADALGDPAPDPRRIVLVGSSAPKPGAPASGDDRAEPLTTPMPLARAPARAELPRLSATGPWVSPLYPQNGVTLWDRIRVSSKRDRRAFLLGTAIQIHDPATAATPGPRSAPQCCPRS